ncbi:MAG: hypothetical protein ACOC5F_04180 [Candidatus Aminicenantaceae bacterium]
MFDKETLLLRLKKYSREKDYQKVNNFLIKNKALVVINFKPYIITRVEKEITGEIQKIHGIEEIRKPFS